ncbi:UNVERIFIED_CONTAM: hypothetical protein GTU68_013826 [Idotea baltica]|nr:hypothetical protein [Idotea baltica]
MHMVYKPFNCMVKKHLNFVIN